MTNRDVEAGYRLDTVRDRRARRDGIRRTLRWRDPNETGEDWPAGLCLGGESAPDQRQRITQRRPALGRILREHSHDRGR